MLDGGTEFKVVDDGTRVVLITDFDGYDETALERYMKLQITGVKGKDSKDFGTPVVVSSSTGEAPEIPYYNIIVDCEDIKITDALRRSGFDTSTKIKNRLYSALSEELGGKFDIDNLVIWDITAVDKANNPLTPENFPSEGIKITIPYANDELKKNFDEYDFTIFHMFGEDRGQIVAGDVEGPLRYNKTDKGIEVIITSLSPFAIHWSKNISDSQESQEGEEDKDTAKPSDSGNNDNKKETAKNILTGDPVSVFLYTSIMLVSLAIALVCFIYGRKNKKKKIHS